MEILRSVLSLPTAPFHEYHVAAFVRRFATERELPVTEDEFGNLIVRCQRGSKTKAIALVAHMDHPGFEVAGVNDNEVVLLAFGDTRGENAVGTRIRFFSTSSLKARGALVSARLRRATSNRGGNPALFAYQPALAEHGNYTQKVITDLAQGVA
jgi:putative aminopeptidase FrvX